MLPSNAYGCILNVILKNVYTVALGPKPFEHHLGGDYCLYHPLNYPNPHSNVWRIIIILSYSVISLTK